MNHFQFGNNVINCLKFDQKGHFETRHVIREERSPVHYKILISWNERVTEYVKISLSFSMANEFGEYLL